jgi:mannose-1-phosphate guanylyltransferase
LVPIKGVPLLQIWLENLVKVGVSKFLINTHYLADEVTTFVNKSEYKDMCILKYENQLLGTAGTLLSNLDYIGNEEVLVVHADNYCLMNFNLFFEAHLTRPKRCLMTMMTFRTDKPHSCGIVEVDEENVLIDFHEKVKSDHGDLANGAIYLLSQEFLKILKSKFPSAQDFSIDIISQFKGHIYTFETNGVFIDIGTPETYIKANLISC